MSGLDTLISLARQAMERAYAPYSGFHVGACLRTDSERLYAAANVENAAYPQGQCAEASAIGMMIAGGDRRIVEVVVMGGQPGDGMLCTPCGGCRQRLREFAGPDTPIHVCGPEGLRRTVTLDQLLPLSFGPDNLSF
jgi:cytidine deaminase